MRLIVGGGRAVESSDSRGAVIVGVRTLSEGGRVGNFSREQVRVKYSNPSSTTGSSVRWLVKT